LVIDDTVLDKLWGKATEWVYKLYSSKHKRVIEGIGIVVLLVAIVGKYRIPLGMRIYKRKEDGKTKLDLMREMAFDTSESPPLTSSWRTISHFRKMKAHRAFTPYYLLSVV
ncbi:MAG: hypothetical protein GXO39_02095, partial [Thermotogae bacterium]|nr:hypothetical protein [Thermotogota bacterium]